jgi:hypothetical protein
VCCAAQDLHTAAAEVSHHRMLFLARAAVDAGTHRQHADGQKLAVIGKPLDVAVPMPSLSTRGTPLALPQSIGSMADPSR